MAPLEQVVPAATACQTMLPPLQRPNCDGPLQTTAPSLVHWPEVLALPLLLPEDAGEPDGVAAEPEEGPETPWPREGERVGYGGAAALEAGTVMVWKDDVGRTTAVLAGVEAEAAALEVAIEDDSAEEAALEVATADNSAEEAAG
jgi:hypothetical protein